MDNRLNKHRLGFWEIKDKPSAVELNQYYADKYYQEGKGSYASNYTEKELAYFQAKLEQRASIAQKYHIADNQGKKFLDVGCGEGYALAFFRRNGWDVKGFDFSSAGMESKNPDCLDKLVVGDVFNLIDNEIQSNNQYDIIWLQNVLEHVLEPIELLDSLKSLVCPNGLLVVTVPNDCSITQQAALKNGHITDAFWVAPPDHLSYFSYDSLINVAHETGWKHLDIIADFPVDWFLFNKNSNYVENKRLGKKAHIARVEIENAIHQRPINDVIEFWAAAAKLGVGRDLTAFLTPQLDVSRDE